MPGGVIVKFGAVNIDLLSKFGVALFCRYLQDSYAH